jgi:hypothetical protein
MEQAPAGAGGSSGARRSRTGSPAPKPTGNGATPPAGAPRSNGRRRTAPVQAEGELSGPVQLGTPLLQSLPLEDEEEGLSGPVQLDTPPLQVLPPEYGKAAHLAVVRFRIALFSIAILSFVVVASFVTLWLGQSVDNLTRVLEIIFAPLVALVAAAVAFYYRSNLL